METIKVRKTDLLTKVQANRTEHRDIFEEALKGYRKKAIQLLEEHIERIKIHAPERVNVALPFPEDHTDEYDLVIAMLEMTIEDEIELDQSEFQRWVLDNWAWTRQFLTSNAPYSGKARTKFGSV